MHSKFHIIIARSLFQGKLIYFKPRIASDLSSRCINYLVYSRCQCKRSYATNLSFKLRDSQRLKYGSNSVAPSFRHTAQLDKNGTSKPDQRDQYDADSKTRFGGLNNVAPRKTRAVDELATNNKGFRDRSPSIDTRSEYNRGLKNWKQGKQEKPPIKLSMTSKDKSKNAFQFSKWMSNTSIMGSEDQAKKKRIAPVKLTAVAASIHLPQFVTIVNFSKLLGVRFGMHNLYMRIFQHKLTVY